MISIIHTWRKPHKFTFHKEEHFLYLISFLREKHWARKNVKWEKFVIWFSINNLLEYSSIRLRKAGKTTQFRAHDSNERLQWIVYKFQNETKLQNQTILHEKLNVSISCCVYEGGGSCTYICWPSCVNKILLSRLPAKILSQYSPQIEAGAENSNILTIIYSEMVNYSYT